MAKVQKKPKPVEPTIAMSPAVRQNTARSTAILKVSLIAAGIALVTYLIVRKK